MKKRESRLHNRQRQRMSRKMVIIIGSSIACLVMALIVVINISNVDEAKAAMMGATSKNVVIIPDEVYPVSISMKEMPAVKPVPVPANAQLGHIAKPISNN